MTESPIDDVANLVIDNIIKVSNVILNVFWCDFRKDIKNA